MRVTGEEWQRRRGIDLTLSALERQMRIIMQLQFETLACIAMPKRLDELEREHVDRESEADAR